MLAKKIGIFVGSLRKDSYNLKMAKALIELAPNSLSFDILEIGNLSHYDQDLDENPPRIWSVFRKRITRLDGVIFLTPEYNRSIPGVLKNAIDIGSRPYGQNAFNSLPGAIISVSVGSLGGFGANHHLRQIATFVNIPMMAQPESYIGDVANLFNEYGTLVNDSTREFVKIFMSKYEVWISKNVKEVVQQGVTNE